MSKKTVQKGVLTIITHASLNVISILKIDFCTMYVASNTYSMKYLCDMWTISRCTNFFFFLLDKANALKFKSTNLLTKSGDDFRDESENGQTSDHFPSEFMLFKYLLIWML